jgi:hypothetical protein
MWKLFIEFGFLILFGWIVIWLTLPFEEKYDETLREYAKEPLFRIAIGVLLICVSLFSVPVSLLLFIIAFFWITDVHLVSSIKFDTT